MSRLARTFGRTVALPTVLALVIGAAVAVTTSVSAAAAPAGLSPVVERGSSDVTADALPTVQIDGVVWSQAIAGNTVYAGGSFANARPAGAAAGTNLTPRANLLAYTLSTGVLNTSFAPSLNAQVKAVAASPDGSRIYVGGSFTSANGVTRNRIAAYSTSTGQLITSFAPSVDATVNAIVATNTTVYVGGAFSQSSGQPRSHLAAFSASTGALLAWAPSTDDVVQALVLSPDNSRLILGGSFENVNGSPAYGLASVDAVNGALYPFAANTVVRDAGTDAAILSLSTDGTAVYSTAFVYGTTGNFEGVMSADPYTGNINWLADCHGDTYGAYSTGSTVYVVSHMHYCANVGGFPETTPRTFYRTTSFTADATGTLPHNGQTGGGYGDFYGQPSPSLKNWYPSLAVGSYTGQTQAAWSVTGNSQYVVEGGEFPSVNGTAQQGLVRFAVPSIAPKKQGPRVSADGFNTNILPRSGTSVRVSWQTNWDRDNQNLTYAVIRDGATVYTTSAVSQLWNRPVIGFYDNSVSPGTTYTYKIRATDPDGNIATSSSYTVTTPTTTAPTDGAYVKDVLGAGASDFWRLDQSAGATTNYDYAGFNDLNLSSGVTAGATGAINDGNSASSFNGTSTGFAATSTAIPGPNTFTLSAWFSTTLKSGGKIVGFGNSNTGNSSNYDRHIYMDSSGRINFGVYNNALYTITTPTAYNDGQYHQVVASLSSAGMALYVDGKLIGTNAGTTIGQPYNGYWRVGGDSTWAGNRYFTGRIDDVAVFPTALSLSQVRQQYLDSGRSFVGSTPPADGYGSTVWNDTPNVYYRLNETNGKTATDVSGSANDGTYSGGYTMGVSSPVTTTGTAVTFNGSTGTVASGLQTPAPSVYSEELWFKTSTTQGGKLIGFGNAKTGNSSTFDRHVYMLPSGQLVFGTYTGTQNLATSPKAYNDGAWHYLAATQGPQGMALYVDGQQVATNPQTAAQAYSGYWRIGGDNLSSWSSGGFFAGTIDEAAVYPTQLSAAQVLEHYKASPAATNVAPTASFTTSANGSTVSFDGTGSSDADGSIAAYAWTFGDGGTSTSATPSHTYATSGTYTVKLTVTDDQGATNTTSKAIDVTVSVNQAPTASFTADSTDRSVAFDGTGSSDPDGSIASYAWDFGDGATSTSATPTHLYAADGAYTVKLTVTDDQGATNTASKTVTVAANQAPTAAFTADATDLSVSFDGTGSSDPDGSIAGYDWDFGDGGTSSSATPTHAYASSGSYSVTLTVTDDKGASGFITKTVTVTTTGGVIAADKFTRTATGTWGSADTGGAWTLSGSLSRFSVDGSVGRMSLPTAGVTDAAYLNGVSQLNSDAVVDTSADTAATGGGIYLSLIARHVGKNDYRLKELLKPNGVVHLVLSRIVNGVETTLKEVNITTVNYSVGDVLRLRFQVSGSGGTATLAGKIWEAGAAEPAAAQISVTDSTPDLQVAGGSGLASVLSGTATTVPVMTTYDNLSVVAS